MEAHRDSNSHGMSATVITWGGIRTSLCVPNRGLKNRMHGLREQISPAWHRLNNHSGSKDYSWSGCILHKNVRAVHLRCRL
jgi:hypothetical protein